MADDQFDQPPLAQPPVPGLGFVRLGGDPESVIDSLGPLSHLLGTWVGNHGWNVIAVPDMNGTRESFRLLVRPYIESITFTPLGAPVPDRGGAETLFITGLEYDLRVTDAETNQPLHLENGMWLFLNQVQAPGAPQIVRQATIPHGDSVLAMGHFSVTNGPPQFPVISALPDAGDAPSGYTDPYLTSPIDTSKMNQLLEAAVKEQTIVQTVTLDVSTQNDGGIVNIPFVVKHANATAFQGTFWIETVKSQETGTEFEQLQYVQQTNINFLPKFGDPTQLIMWPHINVNTLVKQ